MIEALPQAGSLGLEDPRIIARGDPARSVLLARLRSLDGSRMPPLASHRVDDRAVALVEAWIASM